MGRKNGRIEQQRRLKDHLCWDHLIVAPLWVAYPVNLGTLLRTCDAVGACMAVPDTPHYRESIEQGNTLRYRAHIHWVHEKESWVTQQRKTSRVLGVELDEDAVTLSQVPLPKQRTVVLLGNETTGIPPEVFPLVDQLVEIPMIGVGKSLNVAVAGSLVLYKLAGLC